MASAEDKEKLEQSLEELHRALVQHWGIWPVGHKRLQREALIEELSRRVEFLMKYDFDRLCYCMYTIDVPEEKFAEAVKRPEEEQPAKLIAELIIEREVQKMESRRRYARREKTTVTMRVPAEEEQSGDAGA